MTILPPKPDSSIYLLFFKLCGLSLLIAYRYLIQWFYKKHLECVTFTCFKCITFLIHDGKYGPVLVVFIIKQIKCSVSVVTFSF